MQRFKYLADLVKKSREKKDEEGADSVTLPETSLPCKVGQEEEEVHDPEPPPLPLKQKGNKISKKEKRRQRELERHSSTSSTDPTDSPDWCMVDDDEE